MGAYKKVTRKGSSNIDPANTSWQTLWSTKNEQQTPNKTTSKVWFSFMELKATFNNI